LVPILYNSFEECPQQIVIWYRFFLYSWKTFQFPFYSIFYLWLIHRKWIKNDQKMKVRMLSCFQCIKLWSFIVHPFYFILSHKLSNHWQMNSVGHSPWFINCLHFWFGRQCNKLHPMQSNWPGFIVEQTGNSPIPPRLLLIRPIFRHSNRPIPNAFGSAWTHFNPWGHWMPGSLQGRHSSGSVLDCFWMQICGKWSALIGKKVVEMNLKSGQELELIRMEWSNFISQMKAIKFYTKIEENYDFDTVDRLIKKLTSNLNF
jgi:hypothetical protein